MKTKIYRVQGKFIMGDKFKPFTRELKAMGEDDIKEKIYSEFGSKHHIVRNQIHINKIEEISAEDVVDPLIKTLVAE